MDTDQHIAALHATLDLRRSSILMRLAGREIRRGARLEDLVGVVVDAGEGMALLDVQRAADVISLTTELQLQVVASELLDRLVRQVAPGMLRVLVVRERGLWRVRLPFPEIRVCGGDA